MSIDNFYDNITQMEGILKTIKSHYNDSTRNHLTERMKLQQLLNFLELNATNEKLSDLEFRQVVINTLKE